MSVKLTSGVGSSTGWSVPEYGGVMQVTASCSTWGMPTSRTMPRNDVPRTCDYDASSIAVVLTFVVEPGTVGSGYGADRSRRGADS